MCGTAANRVEMNRGCGDKSGRWLFEEFQFADYIFGSAIVEYNVAFIRPHKADDCLFGPGMNVGEIEIFDVVIKELIINDDDGNSIELDIDSRIEASLIVLEAFEAIKGTDVHEFESQRCDRG